MNVLVTGAAGFIGSHLVDFLIKNGYRVHSLDDLSGGTKKNLNPHSRFWKIDLRSKQETEKAIIKINPEVIFHLAAEAAEGKSQFFPIDITQRNYLSTLNLLVPAIKHGLRRFVFTSTASIYGSQTPPFTEEMIPRPEDLYSVSKYASEEAIKILAKVYGFEWVITRLHNCYGPRQNMADPYRNVIAIFMNRLLKSKPFYIYGDGKQKRAFSYIEDIIPAVAKCGLLKKVSGEIINIGAEKAYTINELVEIIGKISQKKIKIIYVPLRDCEVEMVFCDHSKAKMILKFEEKTTLREGLLKTWRWICSEGYKKPVYEKSELGECNMPITWRKKLI